MSRELRQPEWAVEVNDFDYLAHYDLKNTYEKWMT